jgi:glycosyltransferase involved in cell wall biosynthesis
VTSKVRLAVVTANRPHPAHSIRAANVVIFELIRALAARPELDVGWLLVEHEGGPHATEEEEAGRQILQSAGVSVIGEMILPRPTRIGSRIDRLLFPKIEHFYPDYAHSALIGRELSKWQADVAFVPWSEWLTAACAGVPMVKFAYYGNPDPKTGRARTYHDIRLEGLSLARLATLVGLRQLEKMHLAVMRKLDLIGDVAMNDAEYYRGNKFDNAFYIRNIWIDRLGEAWRARRKYLETTNPFRIIANVGKLSGTANRLGLEYLGRELLPALRQRMAPGSFVIEILGSGNVHPKIARDLAGPDVVLRGFVDDIDEAMLTAPIFLCVNNATSFNVGHTRYLHAWTLGCCVIAHQNAALAMPEIEHGKNALLGNSAAEIADLIASAAKDPTLRESIGEGGWLSYKQYFTADQVAADIADRIAGHFKSDRG